MLYLSLWSDLKFQTDLTECCKYKNRLNIDPKINAKFIIINYIYILHFEKLCQAPEINAGSTNSTEVVIKTSLQDHQETHKWFLTVSLIKWGNYFYP